MRILDAEVAEKVMGWRLEDGLWLTDANEPVYPETRGDEANWDMSEPYLPRFSTDMNAAWMVASKMRLSVLCDTETGRWLVGKFDDYAYLDDGIVDGHIEPCVEADNAPEAICRAALLLTNVSRLI